LISSSPLKDVTRVIDSLFLRPCLGISSYLYPEAENDFLSFSLALDFEVEALLFDVDTEGDGEVMVELLLAEELDLDFEELDFAYKRRCARSVKLFVLPKVLIVIFLYKLLLKEAFDLRMQVQRPLDLATDFVVVLLMGMKRHFERNFVVWVL
jgi:hypothetical protein